MRIFRFEGIRFDRDPARIAVDEDDHILRRFALDLQRVEARELEERSRNIHRRCCRSHSLSADSASRLWPFRARIGRDPADGTVGNDQFIFWVFHLVSGVTASQSNLRPKPRPPVNRSFICCVTGFS